MTKVIEEARSGIPECPVQGLRTRCECGALIETCGNEEAEFFEDRQNKKGATLIVIGWEVECPACKKRKVPFLWKGKINGGTFQLLKQGS